MTVSRATLSCILLVMTALACNQSVGLADKPEPVMTTTTPKATVMTVMTTIKATVTAMQSLNVRQFPGHDKPGIGVLYHGDIVVMTGNCTRGWAEIVWKGGVAWLNARYLSDNKCKDKK